jgi:hypothetical protein
MKAMMVELVAPKPNPVVDPKASDDVPTPKATFPLVDFVPKESKVPQKEEGGDRLG